MWHLYVTIVSEFLLLLLQKNRQFQPCSDVFLSHVALFRDLEPYLKVKVKRTDEVPICDDNVVMMMIMIMWTIIIEMINQRIVN